MVCCEDFTSETVAVSWWLIIKYLLILIVFLNLFIIILFYLFISWHKKFSGNAHQIPAACSASGALPGCSSEPQFVLQWEVKQKGNHSFVLWNSPGCAPFKQALWHSGPLDTEQVLFLKLIWLQGYNKVKHNFFTWHGESTGIKVKKQLACILKILGQSLGFVSRL